MEVTVITIIEEFAVLVDMTDNSIDQSQRNFDVITNVLNTTNTIVNNGVFNDSALSQVYTHTTVVWHD